MENSYAAPEASLTSPDVPLTSAEKIRQQHLSHEGSVKSVASLFYLGAILLTLGFSSFLAFSLSAGGSARMEVSSLIFLTLIFLGLLVLLLKVAAGLRNLRPWVRIPVVFLSIPGLFGFPVGTLISGYILYLMFSAKSDRVFSAEYRKIITETPHLPLRTSALRTVLAFLLMLAVAVGLAFYLRATP